MDRRLGRSCLWSSVISTGRRRINENEEARRKWLGCASLARAGARDAIRGGGGGAEHDADGGEGEIGAAEHGARATAARVRQLRPADGRDRALGEGWKYE